MSGREPLLHQNIAQALASRRARRTIAITVQVGIVMGSTDLAAPINCTACQTLALAWR